MDIDVDIFIKPLASALSKKVVDLMGDAFSNSGGDADSGEPTAEKHLQEVLSWSEKLEFFGLDRRLDTDEAAVPLRFSATARRFARDRSGFQTIDEKEIFLHRKHLLVLGDPGAGKSTTVKRACRSLFLESTDGDDDCQYPILVRFRQLPEGLSIIQSIARAVGIHWTFEPKPEHPPLNWEPKLLVGSIELEVAVVDFLEQTRPLIALDGLDEISTERRSVLELEIAKLASKLRRARILMTARSGTYSRPIEGFDIVEILPLSIDQIREICDHYLEDGERFLTEASTLPYFDATSRPLGLVQLIVLYKNYGTLPDQPSAICRRLLSLYIEEWDYLNRVQRTSKYSHFTPERKLDFLSAIAFQLTYIYEGPHLVFSHDRLSDAYKAVYKTFGLPEGEASDVAGELEEHTGILVRCGPEEFEFAHASFQEFLTANYLVRNPFPEKLFDRLCSVPGPVAVSTALAVDSVEWLTSIFLHEEVIYRAQDARQNIGEFLSRLRVEKAHFFDSGFLGWVLIHLAIEFHEHDSIQDELMIWLSDPEMLASAKRALNTYDVSESSTTGSHVLRLRRTHRVQDRTLLPRFGAVRSEFVEFLKGC